jgi:hypothetical protein
MRIPLLAAFVFHVGVGCIDVGSKGCTEAACADGATITIQREDGNTQPLAVELDVDGRRITCPAPAPRSAASGACDDARVRVEHRELFDCLETRSATAVSESCKPNGRLAQVISISGTPQQIAVTLMQGVLVVNQRSFALNYLTVRPNGEGCEPVCRQGSEMWVLPST